MPLPLFPVPFYALVGYALFLVVAIGYRTLIQVRRTGSTGWRFARARPGSVEWFASAGFGLGFLAGAVGAALQLSGRLAPLPALDHTPIKLLGFVLFCIGLAGTFAAQLAMGASWRIGVDANERTALVTGGPFRLVRNPIYTAALATLLGLALLAPTAVSLASWCLFLGSLEVMVRCCEEPYLLATHGDDYRRYAARVGRFLPGIGLMR